MKLIVEEEESHALASALPRGQAKATSVVGEIETRRACARVTPPPPADRLEAVLLPVTTIGLDGEIAQRATSIEPSALRTLDAIHVASALALGGALEALITYDVRLAEAAEAAGLRVLVPR